MNEFWQRTVEFVSRRKRAYQVTLGQPAGRPVLVDLAVFCRANDNTVALNPDGTVNTELTFTLIGRREVWLRIQQHLNIPAEELTAIYAGQPKPQE